SDVTTGLQGTSFTLKKDGETIKLESRLISRYKVGYLAFIAAFALQLGLTKEQVRAGVAKTQPFKHRMQPYQLGGAWVIDDTYNGNLEGIRAGTRLLAEVPAQRKIYVTPGLVDQGDETARIHREVGRLIAEANPDIVVLMKNSVTGYIKEGLKAGGFDGELRIEPDPLDFYTNLNHFVASGDLVVMQNDWPDNYA
ncbi:MAG: glutamate ligase domain-containing protein, partial [Candidatus Saccharimonadales bacterium]